MIFRRCSFFSFIILAFLLSCSDNKIEENSAIQLGIDSASNYQEGRHYETLEKPFPTRDSSKVEVIEFFWLSCGHCYNLEGYVSVWEKTLPNDVDFYRSHITWHAQAETQARLMYTARALGIEEEAIAGAFYAIHRERQLMTGQSELESFFRGLGVSTEKYRAISSSFGDFFIFNPIPIIAHFIFLFTKEEVSIMTPAIFFLFKRISFGHLYLIFILLFIFFKVSPKVIEVINES